MWSVLCIINETDSVGGAADTEQKVNDMATELRQKFPGADIRIYGPADAPPAIVMD